MQLGWVGGVLLEACVLGLRVGGLVKLAHSNLQRGKRAN
jgi:hypothetical protein